MENCRVVIRLFTRYGRKIKMQVPLLFRNIVVYGRALFIKGFIAQILKWARYRHTEDGYTWWEIFRLSFLMVKGERAIIHHRQLMISSVLPPIPSLAFESVIQNRVELAYLPSKMMHRTGPISIFVSVTARCPCRCPHCSRAGRHTTTGELSTTEMKQALSDLVSMHVSNIGFTGGEPLTRKDLPELIASIEGRAGTILFTTGIGLTREKLVQFKTSGLITLAVSFDFLDPDEHNAFRGRDDAYACAIQAMQWGKEVGLHVIAMCVIARKYLSQSYIFALARKAQSFGAREVRLLEPVRSGSYLDKDESLFYTQADREKLITIYRRGNRTLGMVKLTTYLYIEGPEKYGCGAGILHSYLGETGELYPCDFIPASFGNIRQESLKELWQKMRACFGVPKTQCIAKSLNEILYEKSGGELPTSCALSSELTTSHAQTCCTQNIL